MSREVGNFMLELKNITKKVCDWGCFPTSIKGN